LGTVLGRKRELTPERGQPGSSGRKERIKQNVHRQKKE